MSYKINNTACLSLGIDSPLVKLEGRFSFTPSKEIFLAKERALILKCYVKNKVGD